MLSMFPSAIPGRQCPEATKQPLICGCSVASKPLVVLSGHYVESVCTAQVQILRKGTNHLLRQTALHCPCHDVSTVVVHHSCERMLSEPMKGATGGSAERRANDFYFRYVYSCTI